MTTPLFLQRTNRFLPIVAIMPHVLCCLLPLFAAIVSLGAALGFGAVLAFEETAHVLDAYHLPLLMIAIASVVLCGFLNLVAYRNDCRKANASSCTHSDCAPSKAKHFKLFFIACFLLSLDILWFLAETHWLHTHSHTH